MILPVAFVGLKEDCLLRKIRLQRKRNFYRRKLHLRKQIRKLRLERHHTRTALFHQTLHWKWWHGTRREFHRNTKNRKTKNRKFRQPRHHFTANHQHLRRIRKTSSSSWWRQHPIRFVWRERKARQSRPSRCLQRLSIINFHAKKRHRKHAQRHAQRPRYQSRSTQWLTKKPWSVSYLKRFFYRSYSRYPFPIPD